jgi:tetratricopeptide (TPR) repeat protein
MLPFCPPPSTLIGSKALNRTQRRKLIYFASIAIAVACGIWLVRTSGLTTPRLLLCSLILLVPGRLAGLLWRDLLTCRRKLDAKDFDAAIRFSEAFLERLNRHPWLRHVAWLAPSVYTNSPRAMALTNAGAAHLALGHLDEAEQALRSASEADPLNPVPYHNLALLAKARGDAAESNRLAGLAKALGFSRSAADRVLLRSQRLYASIEAKRGS